MQVNKPNKSKYSNSRKGEGKKSRPSPYRSHKTKSHNPIGKSKTPNKTKEEALIDLYEDPYKKTKEEENEEIVINIDFTKPLELLGKLYGQLKKLLQLMLQKVNLDAIKSVNYTNLVKDRRTHIVGASTVGLLILILGYNLIFNRTNGVEVGEVQGELSGDVQIVSGEGDTEFSLLFPSQRTINDYGGVGIVSPPGAPKAYTFVDRIGEGNIQVTQQQIPDNMKPDVSQGLKDLAQEFSANVAVQGDSFTAYVGLNSIGGPQSVVAIKNDLLILIKTDKEVPGELLGEYLESLQ